jgi:hypothetical protein
VSWIFQKSLKLNCMSGTHTVLHKRMTNFVTWIAPDPDKVKAIGDRANEIRACIKKKAEDDGLVVKSTPKGGSFEKKTGIRRHFRGHAAVDGLDVDLPFVVEPKDEEGKKIDALLNRFEEYAKKCYPTTERKRTKKSIKLTFSDKTTYEIVPMLTTNKDDEQLIITSDDKKIRTSVQKHNDFVKNRTRESDTIAGRVLFNECVRLVKWWREIQSADSFYLDCDTNNDADNRPPSALLEWLCAYAYDKRGVKKTYHETFAAWFSLLANIVRERKSVISTDYYNTPSVTDKSAWIVLDPVSSKNNIVSGWEDGKLNEFAEWFESARDKWAEIERYDEDREDKKSLDVLVELFGNPFLHHS